MQYIITGALFEWLFLFSIASACQLTTSLWSVAYKHFFTLVCV